MSIAPLAESYLVFAVSECSACHCGIRLLTSVTFFAHRDTASRGALRLSA